MNTKISYLYRDGDNYKRYNSAVLDGAISSKQEEAIFNSLDSREYFIPEQVGLPADRLDEYARTDADHEWLELLGFEATSAPPTVSVSADELVKNFLAAKGNWKPDMANF